MRSLVGIIQKRPWSCPDMFIPKNYIIEILFCLSSCTLFRWRITCTVWSSASVFQRSCTVAVTCREWIVLLAALWQLSGSGSVPQEPSVCPGNRPIPPLTWGSKSCQVLISCVDRQLCLALALQFSSFSRKSLESGKGYKFWANVACFLLVCHGVCAFGAAVLCTTPFNIALLSKTFLVYYLIPYTLFCSTWGPRRLCFTMK